MVGLHQFGLIGRGISHSFSAGFFNEKFKRERIEAAYTNFDLPEISLFPEIIKSHPALKGLNVTSPYKRDVIRFMDDLSDNAAALKAVNVVEFIHDGSGGLSLKGHNTDCPGFGMTLGLLPFRPSKAAVLGTGGASSAVSLALSLHGIPFRIVSRNPDADNISYGEFNAEIEKYDLIVNATPLGMFPNVDLAPPIDYSRLSSSQICYDLIYNPSETLFLAKAKSMGSITINGLQMLINQAELSWDIWNQITAS